MPFLDSSRHIARVYRGIVRASVVREMEFRTNFWAGISQQVIWIGIYILIIETVFSQTESLAGWSRPEVFIVLALSRIVEGLMYVLFSQNIGAIPAQVNDGTFDFTLLRPLPAQLYSAFRHFWLHNIGTFLGGVVLLVYGLSVSDLTVSLANTTLFIVLICVGMTIFYSLLIIVATVGFFLERFEAIWAFFHIFSEPFTYPFDIFPRGPRIALTYILPLAFVVFVPAQAITGRLQWWQLPVGIGIAAIFLILANVAWRAGLRRYSSASS